MGWDDDPIVGKDDPPKAGEKFGHEDEIIQQPQIAPTKQKPSTKGGWADSLDPTLRNTLQLGIPTAGAIAGELAAAPLTGGMSLLPAALTLATAAGVGGLGGEAVSQALGISPRDFEAQKMALMGGPLGRTITGVVQGIPRMIPGFASSLKASFATDARSPEWINKLLPGPSSEHIYSQLGKELTSTRKLTQFPQTLETVKKLSTEADHIPWEQLRTQMGEGGAAKLYAQIEGSLKGTASTTKSVPPSVGGKTLKGTGLPSQTVTVPGQEAGLTFDELRSSVEGLNKVINSTPDRVLRGDYIKVKKALLQDLEQMPPMKGVPTDVWKEAQHAHKMERARTALLEATESSITTKEGVDFFNPDKMITWLRKGGKDEIMSRVGPQEYRKILNTYRSLSSTIGHDWPKFFAMLMGGTIGSTMGGAGGAVQGVSTGYIASDALSKAMMTETGRKWVRAVASDPRTSTFRRMGTAAGAYQANKLAHEEEE